MKKYKKGYTSGVYDLFHAGHLNIFKNAKKLCDYLVVAVSTDDVVKNNKNKEPIIPFKERLEIVSSIKFVDEAVPQTDYSIEGKINAVKQFNVDVVFVGSDWKGTEKWNLIEKRLKEIGCDVIYLPHTDGISSTILRNKLKIK